MVPNVRRVIGVLGECIENLRDYDSPDRDKHFETADMTTKIAKQMINAGDLILRAEKLVGEGRVEADKLREILG